MNSLSLSSITFFTLVGLTVTASESDQTVRVGIWRNEGSRDILGRGTAQLVRLSKTNENWEITFTTISYPSVNNRVSPSKESRGPFVVTARDGVLAFKEDNKIMEYTYGFSTNGFTFPAFVKMDTRTWRFKSPSGEGTFQCEFDPLVTPIGKAQFPTAAPPEFPRYYIYERGPNNRPENDRARQLRFMERMPDGSLSGDCRFIWDECGQPRFEGSSWYYNYREVLYAPLSETGFRMIQLLPNKDSVTNVQGAAPSQTANPLRNQ